MTGGNSGIGRAIALALGAAGADVVVNFVSGDEAAEAVADGIRSCGARALPIKADVSPEDQVEAMFDRAVDAPGGLDVLVNNAGLQRDAPIAAMTLDQWNTVIGVNLTGQFLCARAAVRAFRRQGFRPEVSRALGKIVCVSSVHEVIPWAGHVNYAASKGGVMLMMRTLAQDLAPERSASSALMGVRYAPPSTPRPGARRRPTPNSCS